MNTNNIDGSVTAAMLQNALRLLGEKETLEKDMKADVEAIQAAENNLKGKREKLATILGEIRQNGIPSASSPYLAETVKASKTGRVVSEETKAKMKAAWAARKAAKETVATTGETPAAPETGL